MPGVSKRGVRMIRLSRLGAVVMLVGAALGGAPVPAAGAQSCDGLEVTIQGTDGDDVIRGTRRSDVISGGGGGDVIRGRGGKDRICGGAGRDRIFGGSRADRLNGGRGADRLEGGRGKDSQHGGSGRDTFDGGPGRDSAEFQGGGPVDVDLRADRARTGDGAERLTSVENVTGSGGADEIRGDARRNGLGAARAPTTSRCRVRRGGRASTVGRDETSLRSRFFCSSRIGRPASTSASRRPRSLRLACGWSTSRTRAAAPGTT